MIRELAALAVITVPPTLALALLPLQTARWVGIALALGMLAVAIPMLHGRR